jgi:glycosyltransferase involved in cell wall biosynthesis
MFVADLCQGLARRFDVTVLAPGSSGAVARERDDGVGVLRYTYSWPPSTQKLADGAILPNLRAHPLLAAQAPLLVAAQLHAAWRLARTGAFDVIHAHWALPQGWIAALLKRAYGIPVLTTTHGGDIYALKSAPAIRAKQFALRSSDRVTAVSTALKRRVIALGVDEQRVDILPMGVDTSRFAPDAASPELRTRINPLGPVLLFVGRLVEKKGARYAVEAMSTIASLHPGAHLVVIGDGPERPKLEKLTRERHLQDRVLFLGSVPNAELPAYYASADVFIGPSVVEPNGDTESFGVVFAEAMASGCPVVATDAGGIADVTGNGELACLVPQRDAEAIAAAVDELLHNRPRHADLRAAGIEAMRTRFDHRRIHQSYADVIDEIAA